MTPPGPYVLYLDHEQMIDLVGWLAWRKREPEPDQFLYASALGPQLRRVVVAVDGGPWPAETIARRLHVTVDVAVAWLLGLRGQGYVERVQGEVGVYWRLARRVVIDVEVG